MKKLKKITRKRIIKYEKNWKKHWKKVNRIAKKIYWKNEKSRIGKMKKLNNEAIERKWTE